MELFRIVICQTLKLRVPVPERHSSEIKLNQPVQVLTSAATTPFPGIVTRINPTVEQTTRSFQVEIQVPNPEGRLKPGSFAKASILTRLDENAVTIPLAALVHFAGVTKVFLDVNGRAKEVHVTPGYQTTEWVEIVQPELPIGAKAITSGQSVIADDTPVTVRQADSPSSEPTTSPRGATKQEVPKDQPDLRKDQDVRK
jgi:RND family efflux transporter MFP subunit